MFAVSLSRRSAGLCALRGAGAEHAVDIPVDLSVQQTCVQHHFCATCGTAPSGEGTGPDRAKVAAVNLRCVPDLDLDASSVVKVDGRSF